jgi:hypothetical protein
MSAASGRAPGHEFDRLARDAGIALAEMRAATNAALMRHELARASAVPQPRVAATARFASRGRFMVSDMSELTLTDYAADLVLQAQRVADIADEVAGHVAADKLDAAVLVLGVSHGKLAELNESMVTLQRRLQGAGADWERAVGRE